MEQNVTISSFLLVNHCSTKTPDNSRNSKYFICLLTKSKSSSCFVDETWMLLMRGVWTPYLDREERQSWEAMHPLKSMIMSPMKWVLTQSLNNNPFNLFVGTQCICHLTTVIRTHPWFQPTVWAAWGQLQQEEGIMEPGIRPTVRVWRLFLIPRDPDPIISFTTICLHHPIKFSPYLQLHHLQEATITTVTVNESMPIWSRVACIRSQVRNSNNCLISSHDIFHLKYP